MHEEIAQNARNLPEMAAAVGVNSYVQRNCSIAG